MSWRALFLAVLAAFLFDGHVFASDSKLPGSAVKLEDAVAKADAIFIAEVSVVGFTEGTHDQMGATIKFGDTLFGPTYDSPWGATVFFVLSGAEKVPTSGTSYIFCVTSHPQSDPQKTVQFTLVKLLAATPENIAAIKQSVAQRTK